MMGFVNSSVASMQDGDSPPYYEISSMEGSGDTCAVICISGSGELHRPRALYTDAQIFLASGLDLKGHPQLATLAGSATSIRVFHLRSTEASEGEQCRLNTVHFLRNRPLSPKIFSAGCRAVQPTCRYDCPGQIHYHERSSPVGATLYVHLSRSYRISICIHN